MLKCEICLLKSTFHCIYAHSRFVVYVSIGYKSEIIYNAFSIKYSLDRKLLLKNLQLVIKFGFQILKEDMQKVVFF